MPISKRLLEIREHAGEGYCPVIDYGSWRVAVFNYSKDSSAGAVLKMHRHMQTDEVFVLLRGKCVLFVANGKKKAGSIFAENMRPFKLYNVKKTVWHVHVTGRGAKILIVENRNTALKNSPRCLLSPKQLRTIYKLAGRVGK
jgi:hypothetical protein